MGVFGVGLVLFWVGVFVGFGVVGVWGGCVVWGVGGGVVLLFFVLWVFWCLVLGFLGLVVWLFVCRCVLVGVGGVRFGGGFLWFGVLGWGYW